MYSIIARIEKIRPPFNGSEDQKWIWGSKIILNSHHKILICCCSLRIQCIELKMLHNTVCKYHQPHNYIETWQTLIAICYRVVYLGCAPCWRPHCCCSAHLFSNSCSLILLLSLLLLFIKPFTSPVWTASICGLTNVIILTPPLPFSAAIFHSWDECMPLLIPPMLIWCFGQALRGIHATCCPLPLGCCHIIINICFAFFNEAFWGLCLMYMYI